MDVSFELTHARLRVVSAVFSNLVAGWLAAMLLTVDPVALTGNLIGVIVSVFLAVKAEELLEEL